MPKPEQLLIIDPPLELKFVGPFTSVVTTELRLKNPTDKGVLYKVRTTAPMRYCVRPNCGLLAPSEQVVISLSLQPGKHDPNERTVDKFMVMSMIAPRGNTDTMEEIWKAANPGQISDTKLRCTFGTQTIVWDHSDIMPHPSTNVVPNCGDSSHKKKENESIPVARSIPVTEFLSELEKLKMEHKKLSDEGLLLRNVTTAQHEDFSLSRPPAKIQEQCVTFFGPLPPIFCMIIVLLFGIIIGKFFV